MLCPKPVVILRDDTWFDGTTKGMVHFSLSPSATTSTRCTPPRWSTPSLRCLCNKESLPQSVSRKWMRCCSLSTASTSAGSPTPTRSAPGCSTTLTRARLGCASRWSLEGKDNALLYADGRERETKPCCKKKSCTVCGWIDHAEQHRGGSEQGKAPGFAAPGDYSHGQSWSTCKIMPEVQSVPIMLGWTRSSHRLHDGRCTSQDVYRVHTDGVVMSKPMEELPLGDGVGKKKGEWKVEKGSMWGGERECGGVRMRCAACTLTGWQWSSKWKSRDGTGEWKSWSLSTKKQAVHH